MILKKSQKLVENHFLHFKLFFEWCFDKCAAGQDIPAKICKNISFFISTEIYE
jgi:hypothetical protein